MDEKNKLKKHIDSIISLTNEEFLIFSDLLKLVTLKKNDYFLKEGQICNYIGFVNCGVLVYFKTVDNGTELTTDFAFDGDWVTNNQSRLNNLPSSINIKAIETSELLVVKHQDLSDLYYRMPKIERLGRILMEQAYLRIVQQSIDLQVLSAKERYEELLLKFPKIFQKVPLYHIANYLGIAPKSLSRIRKEILH